MSYIRMAMGFQVTLPYASRILVPGIACLLSQFVGLDIAFFIQTFFFLNGSGALLYLILRSWGFNRHLCITGEIIFISLGQATKRFMFNFWSTDPALYFFIALSFLSIIHYRDDIFTLSLILGLLSREAMIIMVPIYFILAAPSHFRNQEHVKKSLLLFCLSLGVLFLSRLAAIPGGEYNLLSVIRDYGIVHLNNLISNPIGSLLGIYVGRSWGIFVALLFLVGSWKRPDVFLYFLPFLLLVYFQVFLTGFYAANMCRVILVGYIPVVILAMTGMNWFVEEYNLPSELPIIAAIGAVLMTIFIDYIDPLAGWDKGLDTIWRNFFPRLYFQLIHIGCVTAMFGLLYLLSVIHRRTPQTRPTINYSSDNIPQHED